MMCPVCGSVGWEKLLYVMDGKLVCHKCGSVTDMRPISPPITFEDRLKAELIRARADLNNSEEEDDLSDQTNFCCGYLNALIDCMSWYQESRPTPPRKR